MFLQFPGIIYDGTEAIMVKIQYLMMPAPFHAKVPMLKILVLF